MTLVTVFATNACARTPKTPVKLVVLNVIVELDPHFKYFYSGLLNAPPKKCANDKV